MASHHHHLLSGNLNWCSLNHRWIEYTDKLYWCLIRLANNWRISVAIDWWCDLFFFSVVWELANCFGRFLRLKYERRNLAGALKCKGQNPAKQFRFRKFKSKKNSRFSAQPHRLKLNQHSRRLFLSHWPAERINIYDWTKLSRSMSLIAFRSFFLSPLSAFRPLSLPMRFVYAIHTILQNAFKRILVFVAVRLSASAKQKPSKRCKFLHNYNARYEIQSTAANRIKKNAALCHDPIPPITHAMRLLLVIKTAPCT